ncbi:MAG: orotidine-5'-phosphate decarboxylase [Methanobacteriaceae archaeon]|jgi:orotidine-5'-phosphate decarboxylase|nr:orotidine-5'-phosphate decarboxylase [Candidatus Methanorudis spinitermitis]
MEIKNNIILAMDLMNLLDAYSVAEKVSKYINTIKIGYPLTLAEGLKTIQVFKENFDFQVICDYKVADIPETNSKIANLSFVAGADGIITHGFVGKDSVESCLKVANEHEKEIFLLTEMSHPGAKMFLQKFSYKIAEMGVAMGIKNYVAPSTRLDRLATIRKIVGNDSFIISPGVGVQGGKAKDTLKYANGLIIGRSIYEDSNPEIAIEKIIESVK